MFGRIQQKFQIGKLDFQFRQRFFDSLTISAIRFYPDIRKNTFDSQLYLIKIPAIVLYVFSFEILLKRIT